MKRIMSVSDFKWVIMKVLESESYLTLYKTSSDHLLTSSFSIPVSSCSITKNGI